MHPELENLKTLLLLLKLIDNSENAQKTGCIKTRKPKMRNSNKDGILTRNQLTTYRNVELETINKASYWQKRKEKVAYNV